MRYVLCGFLPLNPCRAPFSWPACSTIRFSQNHSTYYFFWLRSHWHLPCLHPIIRPVVDRDTFWSQSYQHLSSLEHPLSVLQVSIHSFIRPVVDRDKQAQLAHLREHNREGHFVLEQPAGILQVHPLWGYAAVHQQVHHRQAGPANDYIFNIYAGVIWHYMQQRYTGLHDSLWCSPPTSTPFPGWSCGQLYICRCYLALYAATLHWFAWQFVVQSTNKYTIARLDMWAIIFIIYMPVFLGLTCKIATLGKL